MPLLWDVAEADASLNGISAWRVLVGLAVLHHAGDPAHLCDVTASRVYERMLDEPDRRDALWSLWLLARVDGIDHGIRAVFELLIDWYPQLMETT